MNRQIPSRKVTVRSADSLLMPSAFWYSANILDVEVRHPPGQSTLACRCGETGPALQGWIEQLTRPVFAEALFSRRFGHQAPRRGPKGYR